MRKVLIVTAVALVVYVYTVVLVNHVQAAQVSYKQQTSCIAGYIAQGVERSDIITVDGSATCSIK